MGELLKKFSISNQAVIPATKKLRLVKKVWKPLINFVPRPKLLKKIDEIFSGDVNHIFISGVGGSGKSELIKKYVSMIEENYNNICMINYHGSIRETINQGLFFYTEYLSSQEIEESLKGLSRQEIFLEKMNMLNEIERCLVVLDNVENIEDENIQFLLNANAHVIIITREYINYANMIDITDTMLVEEEVQLFKNTCTVTDISENIIQKLCEVCNRHPLTIILLASLISLNRYELYNIFEKFHSNRKNVFFDTILIEKDRDFKSKEIKNHIATIIDLYGLSKKQKDILLNISFAHPKILSQENFFMKYYKGDQCDIELLQKLNLIRVEMDKIQIHPLLAESIMGILSPNVERCRPVLNYYKVMFDEGRIDEYYLSTIANNMAVFFEDYDGIYQEMLMRGAKYLFYQSEYDISIKVYEYILRFFTNVHDYVQVKYQIGVNLKYIGRYRDSIDVFLDLQKICEKNAKSILLEKKLILILIGIANNYHMLGESLDNTQTKAGYFGSSIAFYKKALHISKSINGVQSISCASIYDNLALMYANIKQYKHAYTNSKLARNLFTKIKGEISFEMAKCYINLGEIYRLNGQEEKALNVYKIAEQIKMKVLPQNHDSHVVTFINIGDILIMMKRYDEAEKYFIKAQDIVSLKFSRTHIYNSYINRGLTTINTIKLK